MKGNKIVYSNQNKTIIFNATRINLGIQILRFLLCFWIVIIHCSHIKKRHRKYLNRGFHVPTFFLLSFYFYYPIISNKNIDKTISRFQRLLIPYIFWPSIRSILKIKNRNEPFTLKNHCLQLLIGSPIHGIFWFQFNLIFVSLIFAIILFAFNKDRIKIMLFIELFCYHLHLSGFIYHILNYTRYFRNNIGSLMELIPLGVNGSILNSINFLIIVKRFTIFYKIFLFYILFILFRYDIFMIKRGFRCSNVSLNIISSFIIFFSFGTISFEKIKEQNYIIMIIQYITQFTGGIYYTHSIVRGFLQKYYIFSVIKGKYSYALIIYVICFFICFLGKNLFKNYKLKYLFL